jgi:hypothetical protein
MLKTLSLSPDEIRDDSAAEIPADDSESRMLRALEALSSAPQPRPPEPPGQRDTGPLRANKPLQPREAFRNDGPHHGNKARHRFVKDGEVPVVHMSPPRARDASANPARNDPEYARLHQLIEEQRQRAELAERTRNEALLQVKSLQTKLAHSELTLTDLQALAQSRLAELTAAQQELARLRAPAAAPAADPNQPMPVKRGPGRPRKIVVAAPPPAPLSLQPAQSQSQAQAQAQPSMDAPPPVKRGPGRPRKIVAAPPQLDLEPEPVQWWLLPPKQKRRG